MDELSFAERAAARKAEARLRYIADMRAFADFCEANPELPTPYPREYIFCDDREEFLRIARLLARGAKITKKIDSSEDGDFVVIRMFGEMELRVSIRRKKLCRLVHEAVYDCPVILEETADAEI